MKNTAVLAGVLFFVSTAYATDTVDLFGDDSSVGKKILREEGAQLSKIEHAIQQELIRSPQQLDTPAFQKLMLERVKLSEQIKKKGDYLHTDFNTVYYPGSDQYYTTIEVIKKDAPERMQLLDSREPVKPYQSKGDLIDQMLTFEALEMDLAMHHQLPPILKTCPVYHCVSDFSHPQLKPYLKVFATGVTQQKKLILETLNHDPIPDRRAAAVFLIGHFKDPKEIMSTLTPHVMDADSGVRNNVMRVIGMTMEKAHLTQIDLHPFLVLLQSPVESDRNKALYVLDNAANAPHARKIIAKESGRTLVALLQLKQPNNHDVAYRLLKKISGKDFNEHDYAAWKHYADSMHNKTFI